MWPSVLHVISCRALFVRSVRFNRLAMLGNICGLCAVCVPSQLDTVWGLFSFSLNKTSFLFKCAVHGVYLGAKRPKPIPYFKHEKRKQHFPGFGQEIFPYFCLVWQSYVRSMLSSGGGSFPCLNVVHNCVCIYVWFVCWMEMYVWITYTVMNTCICYVCCVCYVWYVCYVRDV